MSRMVAIVLCLAVTLSGCAPRSHALMSAAFSAPRAQTPVTPAASIEAWRTFLNKLPAGALVKITLKNGRTIRATLMQVTDAAVVINPRTRVPEPMQTVALGDLTAVDFEVEGPSVAKAVGIGIASGIGTFFTILMIAFASID